MGLIARLQDAVGLAQDLSAALRAGDEAARDLERRRPFDGILGPDGRPIGGQAQGGMRFTTAGGSVAGESGGAGSASGRSVEGGAGGLVSGAAKKIDTNLDKLMAIINAAGVAAPAREDWDRNGANGMLGGFILRTVMELGVSAPTYMLVWVAGWLVYAATAPGETGRASGGVSGYTPGGNRWVTIQSTGPAGGADIGARYVRPGDPPPRPSNWVGRWPPTGQSQGSSASSGMTSTQAGSIASATRQTASALTDAVRELRAINRSLRGDGGISGRAGRD